MRSIKLAGREFCALPGGGASALIGDVDGHCAGPLCAAACTSSAAGAWSTFLGLLPPDPAEAERFASAEAEVEEGKPTPELPLGGGGPETGAAKSAKSPKSSPRRFSCCAGFGFDVPGGGASVGIAKDDESSMECFICAGGRCFATPAFGTLICGGGACRVLLGVPWLCCR